MKSPRELNFGNTISKMLASAAEQGVDVKNVIESILQKMNESDNKSTLPVNAKYYINKHILYNVSFDSNLRNGYIRKITPKGFLCVEESVHGSKTYIEKYYDASTLYIQDVLD